MGRDALTTLLHPFEHGTLQPPETGARVLFLGAQPGLRLPTDFAVELAVVQGFRPDFAGLKREGFAVSPEPTGEGYDLALVLAGRHRGENELRLSEAIGRVKPDGLIVMAGDKTDGVGSLRDRLARGEDRLAAAIARKDRPSPIVETRDGRIIDQERLFGPARTVVPLGGHMSKHHGVVFWLRRTPEAEAFAKRTREWYANWPLTDRRFRTAPGMFSHDRVDPGSKLLAEALPADICGRVADFCAGWGYLSAEIAAHCPKMTALDLYEADFASLEAAKANLATVRSPAIQYFWHDLLSEPVEARYDAIVMNPPFHQRRAAEPEIGSRLIAVAAKALKSRGRLFLVANKGLPYERALAAPFAEFRQIAADNAFKVFAAIR
jgi:16S rRNA (guanine1207-N2)-methyltransferase